MGDCLKTPTQSRFSTSFILVIVWFAFGFFAHLGSSPTKDARSGIRISLSHPLSFDIGSVSLRLFFYCRRSTILIEIAAFAAYTIVAFIAISIEA